MSTGRGRRDAGEHAIASVPVVWLAVLFLVPLAVTLVYSFGHSTYGSVSLGFTLGNYAQALAPLYLETFARTALYAIGCSAICLLAGYPIAYVIARHAGRFRAVALGVVAVPYLTSLLIRVMSWQMVLARGGPLQAVLDALRLHSGPLDLLDSLPAVVIGTVAVYLPIAVLAMAVVIDRVPAELVEASRDLGGDDWQTWLAVTLPLSRPGVATAALLTAVPMLGELVIPQLLGGGKGLLMGQAISTEFVESQNYAVGSAMVVLLVIAVAVLVAVLTRLSRGFAEAGR